MFSDLTKGQAQLVRAMNDNRDSDCASELKHELESNEFMSSLDIDTRPIDDSHGPVIRTYESYVVQLKETDELLNNEHFRKEFLDMLPDNVKQSVEGSAELEKEALKELLPDELMLKIVTTPLHNYRDPDWGNTEARPFDVPALYRRELDGDMTVFIVPKVEVLLGEEVIQGLGIGEEDRYPQFKLVDAHGGGQCGSYCPKGGEPRVVLLDWSCAIPNVESIDDEGLAHESSGTSGFDIDQARMLISAQDPESELGQWIQADDLRQLLFDGVRQDLEQGIYHSAEWDDMEETLSVMLSYQDTEVTGAEFVAEFRRRLGIDE